MVINLKKNLDKVKPPKTKDQWLSKICSLQRGFVISRFFFVYFTIAGAYWGKENRFLYPGLRYKVVHYIGVPLYNETLLKRTNFGNPLVFTI